VILYDHAAPRAENTKGLTQDRLRVFCMMKYIADGNDIEPLRLEREPATVVRQDCDESTGPRQHVHTDQIAGLQALSNG
jgi:hypothetical protein